MLDKPKKSPRTWPLQEAKAKFSELVETVLRDGPQIVTRRGAETVIVVPIDQWRTHPNVMGKRNAIDILLAPEPKAELELPDRKKMRFRMPPKF